MQSSRNESSKSDGQYTFAEQGGPEVLEWVPLAEPHALGKDEVQIRHEAIGVEFIDTMMRSGAMQMQLPSGLGFSGVGRVESAGAEVSGVQTGDRVAYLCSTPGSYSSARIVPAGRVYKLPDQGMSPQVAAGAIFRGLTAWYLANRITPLRKGDVVLVHAVAGGVGLLLLQWLKHLGATVVGTVESRNKVEVAKKYGCDHVVVTPDESFSAMVKEVSAGAGAKVVYESIGKATFEESIDAAARFGYIVSYGWPSGDPDPVPLGTLRTKSLFLTRPTVSQYVAADADFHEGAKCLFNLISAGKILVKYTEFPLEDAARAQQDLVDGKTTGSVVLVPKLDLS
ncbi:UNVERIFIED_ORG: NADPH2:quinone reductase [Paraburkholderia sediminicola]|nr:NADPH2:quinone reductase [Paraburkholderia sediminicola]